MDPYNDSKSNTATLDAPAPPVRKTAPPVEPVHSDWGDEEEKPTGFKKWRGPLIVGLLTICGIAYAVKVLSKADGSGLKKDSVTMIQIMPAAPPPPPPPPPPPEQMKEEMIKQEEDKEEEPDPTPVIDTAVKGPASGGIVVAQQRPSNFLAKRSDGGKTKWGWYASQVQARIGEELRKNPRTRKSSIRIEVRIWVDPATGRVIRAKLGSSTGDAGLDQAMTETIQGTQLQQPPPEGMPMPIVLRVTARRPN
jgi:periplasmic protein TonB